MDGFAIARGYGTGVVTGWLGASAPGLVEDQFDALKGDFRTLPVASRAAPAAGRKMFLTDVVRKALGRDIDNYPQQIGDCVSFGAAHATQVLECCERLLRGVREKYRPVFPPYYYGTGRVYVGHTPPGSPEGSLGSWMAKAVMAYGTLFADEPGVPAYSGRVARAWGDDARYLDRWRPTAQKYPVKSAARVLTWEELADAVCNGYPVTTASGVGYEMRARPDGFHHRGNAWDHQMCFVGVDETWPEPYALILNSWGDVHGRLSDFRDPGVQLPPGLLRVRRADAEAHLAARDSYAYSNFEGFPEQDLATALFDVLA